MNTLFKRQFLYVSPWVRRGESGQPALNIYELDAENGRLLPAGKFETGASCNVSCIDRTRHILYVTGEECTPTLQRQNGARILAFAVDPVDGSLTLHRSFPIGSPNPSYITLDGSCSYLLVSNHTNAAVVYRLEWDAEGRPRTRPMQDDATVCLFRLDEDGYPAAWVDAVVHEGSGPRRTQDHAHPHCAVRSPSGKLFAVCDKGADKIFMYQIDRAHHRLRLSCPPYQCAAGSEPRFSAFHPSLPYFYANHEGDLWIDVFRYAENGALTQLQTVRAAPKEFQEDAGRVNENQGLAMHPSGHFLYSVTRGADGIAVFSIDQETGRLSLLQHMPLVSPWPRCCQISPDGRWLVAGTAVDYRVVLYRIQANGTLSLCDEQYQNCGAAYVTFG